MKRLPLILTVLAVVALSASLAYWGLQFFKPQQRPIAAVPLQPAPQANIEAAKGLFGGQTTVAAVSNYQLKGVVAAAGGVAFGVGSNSTKAKGTGAETDSTGRIVGLTQKAALALQA